ncbi:MAG: hypothetical protein M1281_16365 [Chloroflexi bacterium]|nr:hypothetical protein [Chloroflexota bacterium]
MKKDKQVKNMDYSFAQDIVIFITNLSTRRLFFYNVIFGCIFAGIAWLVGINHWTIVGIAISLCFFFWGVSGLVLILRKDSESIIPISFPGYRARSTGWVLVISGWGIAIASLINIFLKR